MIINEDYDSGYNSGKNRVKEDIICTIIGFQNDNGNKVDSEEYKAYQRVLEYIIREYCYK